MHLDKNNDSNADPDPINSEYIMGNYSYFNTNCYGPSKLDAAILRHYKKTYDFKASYSHNNTQLHLFQKETQRIILFKSVSDFNKNEPGLDLLDSALHFYVHESNQYKPDDILIIPVAGFVRQHFRLLKITPNAIYYYDSKSALISGLLGAGEPLIAAAKIAFDEVYGTAYEMPDETENRSTSTAITQLGMFAYNAMTAYGSATVSVSQICLQYFPQCSFHNCPLGNQAYDEQTDCGPLTVAYAEQAAEGHPDVKEDIINLRARI